MARIELRASDEDRTAWTAKAEAAGVTLSALSERLAAKTASDREEMQAVILSEQRKFAESLRSASKAAHALMESDTAAHQARMASSLRALLRWPLWTAALCVIVILASIAVLWVGTWWMRQNLAEIRSATSAARVERQSEDDNLMRLQLQTRGVSIHTPPDGPALVTVPANTDLTRAVKCTLAGKPKLCIELP